MPMPDSSTLPELAELEQIIELGCPHLQAEVLAEIAVDGRRFPLHAITLGNPSLEVPAVGFFAGVHGLERIGSHVVLHYLRSFVMQLTWDTMLQRQLEVLRLVFVPIVNPGGMWRGTRANPNGVDLMRNAPVEATEKPLFLIGGQRLTPNLPWYRGAFGAAMETEAESVCRLVERELLARSFSIAIDCHSGFGLHDRIWFPYAHTARPFANLPEMYRLKQIFDQTHPHHRYVFEPQSRQYLAHGDLWDFLHQRSGGTTGRTFLPLTLEMGSWIWVKKNPRQLFSRHGIFNPLIEHRQQRVMRRHVAWLDFAARSTCSFRAWIPTGAARDQDHRQALAHWYPHLHKRGGDVLLDAR
jgi:hypothetical protein